MFPIGDTVPRKNVPIATWLLIIINCVIFLFEIAMPQQTLERFCYLFGSCPPDTLTPTGRSGSASH